MKKIKDPVCGMMVDPDTTQYKKDYRSKKIAFCSKECMNQFENNPQKYSNS